MLPDHLRNRYDSGDPQAEDFSCPGLSQADEERAPKDQSEHPENKEEIRGVTRADSTSQKSEIGSGSWIRTNDLVVNSHPLYR